MRISRKKPYFCEKKNKFLEVFEIFNAVEGFEEDEFLVQDSFDCPNKEECREDLSIFECPLEIGNT